MYYVVTRYDTHLLEITSLQFMLVCVPLPVWNTTSGKLSSSFPWTTCVPRRAWNAEKELRESLVSLH